MHANSIIELIREDTRYLDLLAGKERVWMTQIYGKLVREKQIE